MSVSLRIVQAGPGVTIQDAGRWGYLRYGVTQAGPMDALAHEAANIAAGSAPGAAAIEVSVGGLEVVVEGGAVGFAIVGVAFRVFRDGVALPSACLATLQPNQKLAIRAGAGGAWAYLAFSARIDAEGELGSLSMHVRSGVGGRGLEPGDLIALADPREGPAAPVRLADIAEGGDAPIRIVPGPQDDYFDAANFARFLEGPWRISPRSDRMAYALDGPRIEHSKGFNIVSDGIAFGAIQVPGDGAPFVQMADRAPTGGYPKIGTVISADLGRLAQMRPGASLRFEAVSVAAAVAAWRTSREKLGVVLSSGGAREPSPETLLASNLVSGVVSAQD
jgi:5-oxoprolinase (ATP-hydrolysing) subunit C